MAVDVYGLYLVERHLAEQTDREGLTEASDPADGHDGKWLAAALVVDDGAKGQIDRAVFEQTEQPAGDIELEGDGRLVVEAVDERDDVEEADATEARNCRGRSWRSVTCGGRRSVHGGIIGRPAVGAAATVGHGGV